MLACHELEIGVLNKLLSKSLGKPAGANWPGALAVVHRRGKVADLCQPSEGAFDYPATGKPHAAAHGFDQLDDFQLDALLGGSRGGLLAGMALIHVGRPPTSLCRVLDLYRQFANLGAFPCVGRGHQQGQEVPEMNRSQILNTLPAKTRRNHHCWCALHCSML